VWTDSDGDTVEDATEKQILITGFATLLPASGLPGTGAFAAVLGPSTFTIMSSSNGTVTYDRPAERSEWGERLPPAS